MSKIIFFVSKSTSSDHSVEITSTKNGGERGIVSRWPNNNKPETNFREAIGLAVIQALQSKHDYGNNVQLVIELPVCSIDDPVITI